MRTVFPFAAIVGQEDMKRALILNAVFPRIGGVLIRGERGTAKSTTARALAALLPEIDVVKGCPFHCNPEGRIKCRECSARATDETEKFRIPFVELPIGATEDRVAGTLDIEKTLLTGKKHFEPGILADANRGILYVDEVNLLDDSVVDMLLDSAAMGVCTVEREGISYSYPAQFLLVGTMNPEEGELRPQLLDRFAMCVEIASVTGEAQRARILERNIEFSQDSEVFCTRWAGQEQALAGQIQTAAARVETTRFSRKVLSAVTYLTSRCGVEGHRADIAILRTAIANAAFEDRPQVEEDDIALAARLVLPHRLKVNPLGEKLVSQEAFTQLLGQMSARLKGGLEQGEEELNLSFFGKKKHP